MKILYFMYQSPFSDFTLCIMDTLCCVLCEVLSG